MAECMRRNYTSHSGIIPTGSGVISIIIWSRSFSRPVIYPVIIGVNYSEGVSNPHPCELGHSVRGATALVRCFRPNRLFCNRPRNLFVNHSPNPSDIFKPFRGHNGIREKRILPLKMSETLSRIRDSQNSFNPWIFFIWIIAVNLPAGEDVKGFIAIWKMCNSRPFLHKSRKSTSERGDT